ncbi:biotin-[acetyl-CoA-carboxylase] ligase [Campylobacter iguaniorum]|uniref:biotin--[acetyl-CoA-carboxylase] ligase n=1 Tax=Campylobacter iguaniorum TaxID=1244531 RepID=UPI0007C8AC31|nr:biotin--[acetyl-CoA-carboxylase] ligase [Campylobacter iguaniorum]ANE36425.1 biotin-[acetyl-CoA-carboxylase] ligase [Campylobacter iguaniorum]
MVVSFVESCVSTQDELIGAVRNGAINPPFALVAKVQTNGVGSRGNEWESKEGNLYFSFCVDENSLPSDLKPASASIYFAALMSEYLKSCGSKLWLKWPNDFYLGDKKIGGVITTKIKNVYICGIGINLKNSPSFANVLDIETSPQNIVNGFIQYLNLGFSWKQIFSKYLIEFDKSKVFDAHIGGEPVSLKNAILLEDGSIMINNKKVYSLR